MEGGRGWRGGEKYDSVVNSIEGCVDCWAILPAVAVAMNRFFVYSLVPQSPPHPTQHSAELGGTHELLQSGTRTHIILPLCAQLTQTHTQEAWIILMMRKMQAWFGCAESL